jgi:penicillin-binding protein activator
MGVSHDGVEWGNEADRESDIMKSRMMTGSAWWVGLALVVLAAGCASKGVKNPSGIGVTEMEADEKGFVAGTGIESQDLVAVTDKMARSILGIPQIANAADAAGGVAGSGDERDPVPDQQGDVPHPDPGAAEQQVGGQSPVPGPRPDGGAGDRAEPEADGAGDLDGRCAGDGVQGGRLFLTGTLQGLSTRTSSGTSDYILYTFQLIDARTSAIVWEDFAEIKKQGLEDASYR